MARQQLGMEPIAAAAPAAKQDTPPEDPVADPVADAAAEIAQLEANYKTAVADYDTDKQAELLLKITDLKTQIATEKLRAEMAIEREAAQAAAVAQSHEAALAQSRAAVAAQYGEQYKEGSPLTLMMGGIFDHWQSSNDPRMTDPRRPELIAAEAASNLGLKPANEQTASATATATPAVQPTSTPQAPPRSPAPVAPIAPGTARTHDQGPEPVPDFRSLAEYEAFTAK